MEEILVFDWMHINDVMTHIEVNRNSGEVTCIEYTNELPFMFLGFRPKTIESVLNRFRSRCMEESRADFNEWLGVLGLQQFSPLDAVKITHGHMNTDDLWIRFEGEDLEYYKDINVVRPTLEQRTMHKERR